MVAEAGAAEGAQLLGQAGRLEGAGVQGGVGQPILQVIHQLVSVGDLRCKNKGFIPEEVGMQF